MRLVTATVSRAKTCVLTEGASSRSEVGSNTLYFEPSVHENSDMVGSGSTPVTIVLLDLDPHLLIFLTIVLQQCSTSTTDPTWQRGWLTDVLCSLNASIPVWNCYEIIVHGAPMRMLCATNCVHRMCVPFGLQVPWRLLPYMNLNRYLDNTLTQGP